MPVNEEDTKKGKWSVHRSLIVDAIERAQKHWNTLPCESCPLPNPCQGLDSKSLLKSVRCKARPVSCEKDSCVREPEVQQEIVNITALKKNVWLCMSMHRWVDHPTSWLVNLYNVNVFQVQQGNDLNLPR